MALNDQKSGNRKGFFDTLRYVEDFKTEEVKDAKGRIRKVTTYKVPGTLFARPETERS